MAPKRNTTKGLFTEKAIHRTRTGKGPWFYQVLEDPWVAAMRLEAQGGRLVVAEMHVFAMANEKKQAPMSQVVVEDLFSDTEDGGKMTSVEGLTEDLDPDRLRSRARPLPAGGLSTSAVRKVGVQAHLQVSKTWLRVLGSPTFGAVLSPEEIEDMGEAAGTTVSTQRKPDAFYARVAEAYVRHCAKHPKSPVVSLAGELGHKDDQGQVITTTVNNQINEARRRGLLTPGTQGRPGGELTPKAKSLLTRAKKEKSR